MSSAPPEVLFAQHLAANEKVHRDRALRKLQKYLFNHSCLPNGGFKEAELLKIWKGLHYCMWMQDKPLLQEELSDNISNLVHSFNNARTTLLFIKTFYITECREWLSIDKWRMDKFLMMFRNMLTQSFEFLKTKNWSEKLVREFLDFMCRHILHDHSHNTSPDGVKFHLADTYLTELEKVSAGQLGPKQTITFIQPWIGMLSGIQCKTLRAFVIKNIFGELIQQSPVMVGKPRKKGSKKLRVHYQLLADKLLEIGSSEDCLSINRPSIYNLVHNFRDIANGKLPFSPEDQEEPEEVEELQDDDIEDAVKRLSEYQEQVKQENEKERLTLKKKKRYEASEVDEAYGSDSGSESGLPPTTNKEGNLSKQAAKGKPEAKKTAKSPKVQKARVLSKKLQKIIQADKEFMEDDDDDAGEVADDAGEGSEDDYSEQDDDLLYADDDDLDDDFKLVEESLAETNKLSKKAHKKSKTKPGGNMVAGPVKSKQIVSKKNKSGKKESSHTSPATKSTEGVLERVEEDDAVAKTSKTKNKRGKGKKSKSKPTSSAVFEMVEFPESEGVPDIAEVIPDIAEGVPTALAAEPKPTSTKKKAKRRQSEADHNTNNNSIKPRMAASVSKAERASKRLAQFVPEPGAKAKYFKRAMAKSAPVTPISNTAETKTPVRREKKRLSFGKNSSVKKTAVKLRGSLSYDPTKTPEQGILKCNPIPIGTVIQVGKQATMENTLTNSKYPHRMMAMEFN